jgi:hypothetical protein
VIIMPATLHAVFGPCGAGKTTYARALARREGAVAFVLDEWGARLCGVARQDVGGAVIRGTVHLNPPAARGKLRGMSTARVRRAMRLIEQLDMDPSEVKDLGQQLLNRPECVVDWDKVAPEDREIVALVERRLNTPSELLPIADMNRAARERLAFHAKRRREARKASKATSSRRRRSPPPA